MPSLGIGPVAPGEGAHRLGAAVPVDARKNELSYKTDFPGVYNKSWVSVAPIDGTRVEVGPIGRD